MRKSRWRWEHVSPEDLTGLRVEAASLRKRFLKEE